MTQYNNLNTDYQTDHAKFDSTVRSLKSALENQQVVSQHLKQVLLAKMDPDVHPAVQLNRELLKNCPTAEDQELHLQIDNLKTELSQKNEQIKLLTS